ncbi:hypothetical protein BaRGS_00000781 [Batillaria attramentaria]|uniref:Uncharacterized protein n=1 Tax=Batillaria attramentaria TaxID=370345 RepID=A0ABD0M8W1_9CAEN
MHVCRVNSMTCHKEGIAAQKDQETKCTDLRSSAARKIAKQGPGPAQINVGRKQVRQVTSGGPVERTQELIRTDQYCYRTVLLLQRVARWQSESKPDQVCDVLL